MAAAVWSSHAAALPSFQEVQAAHRPSETWLLSREGEPLQRLRTNMQVRQGTWTPLQDMSSAMRMAMVLSEDQRFYAHSGVDWAAVTAAAWGNLWNTRTRGASTITMQLAGLLDEDWRQSGAGRSMTQKLGQAVAAQRLERSWRKDEILEAYLNLVPFRGEIVGIDALSRSLFGKAPHGLDVEEAAIAAALVRAPNASAHRVAQRACGVWRDMMQVQAGNVQAEPSSALPRLRCDALEWKTEQVLQQRRWPASEGIAPHFARQWLQRTNPDLGNAQLRTTLRADVQRVAQQSLQQHLLELSGSNVEDGAVMVLDNASGEVLAWVGSSGSLSQAHEVDAVLARRQPGSTLKPFLYGQAIAEKRLTAASLIEDSAAQIRTSSGLYIPQNYDRSFKGWVSVRTALGSSLNVPAVRALVMVSPDAFFEQLQALGLRLPESGGYYGYSLALGSSEVTLLDLTNAYRALANQGRYTSVHWSGTRAPAKQVLDAGAAFIVGDMLADRNARAMTFGLDSVLGTRFWTAVKTGTSKDMRDNWVVGWSQHYTVGVWVGNASGTAMHNVSGASGAAPVWAEVMAHLHTRQLSQAPQPPEGVMQQTVRYGADPATGTPLEGARNDWFLAGTQQTEFALEPSNTVQTLAGQGRILQPVDGTVLALDPDIPPQQQRLQLRARAASVQSAQQWRWRVAGESVPPAQRNLGHGIQAQWLPWPGRHRIELLAADGRLLDSVQIEVRGAGVK